MSRLLAAVAMALFGGVCAAELPAPVLEAAEAVRGYTGAGSRRPLAVLEQAVARAADPAVRRELAAVLAAPLADRTLPGPARTFLCRQLAAIGSAAEVPTLAAMLDDPARAEDARRALQAMPDPAAGEALRAALQRLTGAALTGVIHSLGERRDAAATGPLAAIASGPDAAASASAVAALGRIASPEAAEALARLPASPARDQALMECADRLWLDGRRAEAQTLCAGLSRTAAASPAERLARTALLCRVAPEEALPVLAAGLGDEEALFRRACIRFLGGLGLPAAAQVLAGALDRLSAEDQVIALEVIGQHRLEAATDEVRSVLASPEAAVRAGAASALGALGRADDVARLLAAAGDADAAVREAAAEALAVLPGEGVDQAVLRAAAEGPPAQRAAALEAAAARQSQGLALLLDRCLADPGDGVRLAAIRVCGRGGDGSVFPRLTAVLAAERAPALRAEAERALIALGRRLPDEAARVDPIAGALASPGTAPEAAAALLRVLGALGGERALAVVRDCAAHGAPAIQDAALRVLADWPDPSAADDLCTRAAEAQNPVHRALLLRGALRLAPQTPEPMARLERLRGLLRGPEEGRLWLSALSQVSSPEALDAALGGLGDAEVRAEAAAAAVRIGAALARRSPREVQAAMARVAAAVAGPQAAAARGVAVEAGGLEAARRLSLEGRPERTAALARDLPAGWSLAAYLDCGVEAEVQAPGGPSLRLAAGQVWLWEGAAGAGGVEAATVAFDPGQVVLEVSGLTPDRPWRVGFTWWDFDNNGRRQSVWAGGRRLMGPADLPAWLGRQEPPAAMAVDLPPEGIAGGRVRIAFRREAASNAVVSEVWLASGPAGSLAPRPGKVAMKRVLIITGRDYPGHLWAQTAPVLRDAIAQDKRLEVTVSEDPLVLGAPELPGYDAIVLHYMNWEDPGPGAAAQENFRRTIEGGTGLVLVHFACGAFQGWPEFVRIAGRVWDPKRRGHDPHGPFRVVIIDRTHPVTAAMDSFDTTDELYTCLAGDTPIQILATARSKVDGTDHPIAFTLRYGKGRVFHSVLGHDAAALANPAAGQLFRRAAAWAAGLEPED